MNKTIRKTIILVLRILREELQNNFITPEQKELVYIEKSNFIKGYCYALTTIISLNSYKLITNYMNRLYDKYIR